MEQNSGHSESQLKLELMTDCCTEEADLISQSKARSENTGLQFLRKPFQSFMVPMLAQLVETQQMVSLFLLVHQAKCSGKTHSCHPSKLKLMTGSEESKTHSMQVVCSSQVHPVGAVVMIPKITKVSSIATHIQSLMSLRLQA